LSEVPLLREISQRNPQPARRTAAALSFAPGMDVSKEDHAVKIA